MNELGTRGVWVWLGSSEDSVATTSDTFLTRDGRKILVVITVVKYFIY
jgi:hypothetical protein